MVVLGAEVVGGAVAGGAVVSGGDVEGVVVVVDRAVAAGDVGLVLWLPRLEPQADRPNATAVRATMASLALETPAAG